MSGDHGRGDSQVAFGRYLVSSVQFWINSLSNNRHNTSINHQDMKWAQINVSCRCKLGCSVYFRRKLLHFCALSALCCAEIRTFLGSAYIPIETWISELTGVFKIEILKTFFFTIFRSIPDLKEAVGPLMRIFLFILTLDFQLESVYC